jgi:exodeoxyribonuclease VIII
MSDITPGVYRDVPEGRYRDWRYASASRLNLLADRSPAHVRWELDHPTPPTPEMVIGSACHSVILTPERFATDYVTAGPCASVLKSGDRKGEECGRPGLHLAAGTWFCGSHGGGPGFAPIRATVLTTEQAQIVERCHEAVTHHPYAGGNLDAATEAELSIVWECPHTGLRMKSRIDAYRPGVLIDLKSTRDASPDAFAKGIVGWGYHRQIAAYMDALEAVGMPVEVAAIIAFEKEPPFAVAMYELHPDDIELGRQESITLRQHYADCERSGEWPGYGEKASMIRLPDWYRARREYR